MTKKIVLVVAAVMVFGFAGINQASAGRGPCPDNCRMMQQDSATQQMEARAELHKKFMAETKELRKDMVTTQAKMRVLLNSENPDIAMAGELAGHIFDLKDKLQAKKDEIGLNCSCCQCGMGCDKGCDKGNGPGCRGNCGGCNAGPRCRM